MIHEVNFWDGTRFVQADSYLDALGVAVHRYQEERARMWNEGGGTSREPSSFELWGHVSIMGREDLLLDPSGEQIGSTCPLCGAPAYKPEYCPACGRVRTTQGTTSEAAGIVHRLEWTGRLHQFLMKHQGETVESVWLAIEEGFAPFCDRHWNNPVMSEALGNFTFLWVEDAIELLSTLGIAHNQPTEEGGKTCWGNARIDRHFRWTIPNAAVGSYPLLHKRMRKV